MTSIDETEARLNTHEAVCAERYNGINARLKRIESIGLSVAAAVIMLLVDLALKVH